MVDVINELTDLTDVSKEGLKLMKISILRALGAQGGYLELARPATVLLYRAESTKLYESLTHSPDRIPGEICCPGMVSDPRNLNFLLLSLIHI